MLLTTEKGTYIPIKYIFNVFYITWLLLPLNVLTVKLSSESYEVNSLLPYNFDLWFVLISPQKFQANIIV